jgi:hypothetical protein
MTSFIKDQGCIFWPLSPPSRGGKKIGTFGSLGKKIDPSEKKNSIVKKKFEFYKQMFFFYYNCNFIKKYIKESSF